MNHPDRFRAILGEIEPVLSGIDVDEFDRVVGLIVDADRVLLAGAGRSGLMIRCFAMRLVQAGVNARVVGDCTTPAITDNDLLLVASGSGRTSTMRAIANRAFGEGSRIAVVTYSAESPLALEAHAPLVLPVPLDATRPGGLAGTQFLGTLFDQCLLLTFDALLEAVAERNNVSGNDMQERHANLE